MTNLEIIKSTYQGTGEQNAANLANFLDENATWTEAKGFPYAGTYVGFDAIVVNVFQRLATEWIAYKVTIEDYVADGDKIVAYGTYSGTYKKTNKYFEARVAHIWKLINKKVISMEQIVDSQIVMKHFTKPTADLIYIFEVVKFLVKIFQDIIILNIKKHSLSQGECFNLIN